MYPKTAIMAAGERKGK